MLRSKKRANEFCSFVCTHRLLDVLAYLKKEKNSNCDEWLLDEVSLLSEQLLCDIDHAL